MNLLFLAVFPVSLFLSSDPASRAQPGRSDRTARCVALLRTTALATDQPFFVRVHAAEALALRGYPEGLEEAFSALQRASPDQFVGATRVLARLHRADAVRYRADVEALLAVFGGEGPFRSRLVALESLAKLGYAEPLPAILREAQEGRDGMMGMARWVLANSGRADDEARLADLLASAEPLAYRYAAYALRFFSRVRPATYARLVACADRLPADDPARVYGLSARFVHAPAEDREAAHEALVAYADGTPGERYEVAEALGRAGDGADLPRLERLLTDADADVRVAAANALLQRER